METVMPSDPRDYKVELTSVPTPTSGSGGVPSASRPFLSILFACCNVYARVYRSSDGSAYRGSCPKCAVPVTFAVGEGGTSSRFFIVR